MRLSNDLRLGRGYGQLPVVYHVLLCLFGSRSLSRADCRTQPKSNGQQGADFHRLQPYRVRLVPADKQKARQTETPAQRAYSQNKLYSYMRPCAHIVALFRTLSNTISEFFAFFFSRQPCGGLGLAPLLGHCVCDTLEGAGAILTSVWSRTHSVYSLFASFYDIRRLQ